MSAGRVIGIIIIGLGVNGIRIGKVLIRSVRPPWPGYFFREKEPLTFWITACLWIALGTFIVSAVLLTRVPV